MSIKGGYKVIDFRGAALSTTPTTMTDILADLLNNYGKVVLLSGVNIGGEDLSDCFSCVLSDGDDGVKLNCYDGYIIVTKEGAVTYTLAEVSEIPNLVSRDNYLSKITGVSIGGDVTLATLFKDLNNYEVANARSYSAYTNGVFGINAVGLLTLFKLSDTTGIVTIVTTNDGNICKGAITVSGNTITWSNRYIFEGTEYTPQV